MLVVGSRYGVETNNKNTTVCSPSAEKQRQGERESTRIEKRVAILIPNPRVTFRNRYRVTHCNTAAPAGQQTQHRATHITATATDDPRAIPYSNEYHGQCYYCSYFRQQ